MEAFRHKDFSPPSILFGNCEKLHPNTITYKSEQPSISPIDLAGHGPATGKHFRTSFTEGTKKIP
jgi:hypothetical protein